MRFFDLLYLNRILIMLKSGFLRNHSVNLGYVNGVYAVTCSLVFNKVILTLY